MIDATDPDAPQWLSAQEIRSRLSVDDAIRAIRDALLGDVDPAADPARSVIEVTNGQVLLMPSATPHHVGVKIATVAPGNPARDRPRIQGLYMLMDAATLTPIAVLDGPELTALRTSAVSAAAADELAPPVVDHLVVFGTGPQANSHVHAMRAIRTIGRVTVVGRTPRRTDAFVAALRRNGIRADVGDPSAVRDAQLVVCATTAREPLFDGGLVPDDSLTVAVGSHEPDARELDGSLISRAQVVVEDRAAALSGSGNIVIPVHDGLLDPHSIVPLRSLVRSEIEVERVLPRVFSSVGMPWEDLAIAVAITAGA